MTETQRRWGRQPERTPGLRGAHGLPMGHGAVPWGLVAGARWTKVRLSSAHNDAANVQFARSQRLRQWSMHQRALAARCTVVRGAGEGETRRGRAMRLGRVVSGGYSTDDRWTIGDGGGAAETASEGFGWNAPPPVPPVGKGAGLQRMGGGLQKLTFVDGYRGFVPNVSACVCFDDYSQPFTKPLPPSPTPQHPSAPRTSQPHHHRESARRANPQHCTALDNMPHPIHDSAHCQSLCTEKTSGTTFCVLGMGCSRTGPCVGASVCAKDWKGSRLGACFSGTVCVTTTTSGAFFFFWPCTAQRRPLVRTQPQDGHGNRHPQEPTQHRTGAKCPAGHTPGVGSRASQPLPPPGPDAHCPPVQTTPCADNGMPRASVLGHRCCGRSAKLAQKWGYHFAALVCGVAVGGCSRPCQGALGRGPWSIRPGDADNHSHTRSAVRAVSHPRGFPCCRQSALLRGGE